MGSQQGRTEVEAGNNLEQPTLGQAAGLPVVQEIPVCPVKEICWGSLCACGRRSKAQAAGADQAGAEERFLNSSAGSSRNFMNVQVTPCHTGITPLKCLCLYQGWNSFVA